MPKISSSPDNIKVTCTLQPVQGWEQNGDNCYLWSTNEKNWSDAEEFCVNEGGHLASITSDAINSYVREGISGHLWIGGNDIHQEGVWQWTDNMPWEFTAWDQGEPNNSGGNEDCLVIWGYSGSGYSWNDGHCHRELRFLCSKKTNSGDAYIFDKQC